MFCFDIKLYCISFFGRKPHPGLGHHRLGRFSHFRTDFKSGSVSPRRLLGILYLATAEILTWQVNMLCLTGYTQVKNQITRPWATNTSCPVTSTILPLSYLVCLQATFSRRADSGGCLYKSCYKCNTRYLMGVSASLSRHNHIYTWPYELFMKDYSTAVSYYVYVDSVQYSGSSPTEEQIF